MPRFQTNASSFDNLPIVYGLQARNAIAEILDYHSKYGTYNFKPIRAMYETESDKFLACDNSTGNCWIEEFDTENEAIDYLNDKSLE